MESEAGREATETARILEKIRVARNFDFRHYKRATLQRRIERRMVERRCESLSSYGDLLDAEPAEYTALVSSLLIKVTSFFRDPEAWEGLSRVIRARLARDKPRGELRVWCAGCATGEEAFSAAILVAEALGPSFAAQDLRIFGTDLDEEAIALARRGIYGEQALSGVSAARRKAWFVPDSGGWAVRKELRRKVVFGVNNLVSDAPISRLDLLVCRNVFIYLDSTLQKRVLSRFHYAVRSGGVLMLGRSELIPFAARVFEPIDLSRRIYRQDGIRGAEVAQGRLNGRTEPESFEQPEQPAIARSALTELQYDVLQSMTVPVVATDLNGSVLLWNTAAAALWGRTESEAVGKRLSSLNLAGLSGELLGERSAAVREGRAQRERATGTMLKSPSDRPLQLLVEVSRLEASCEVVGLLYVVQEVTAFHDLENDLRRANSERQSAYEELQTLNEELQSSNEELETTNEELQSSNEELQTTNEELQSTNEELETTNEELQSASSELDAINHELAHRTEEVNELAWYQRNILRSLSAAVVVVDGQGRISIWNLAAERHLGLAEHEALGQALWTLHVPALPRPILGKARKAISRGVAFRVEEFEYEMVTGTHGRATLVAAPIQDENELKGAVLIFEDSTRVANLSARLEQLAAARPAALTGGSDSRPHHSLPARSRRAKRRSRK